MIRVLESPLHTILNTHLYIGTTCIFFLKASVTEEERSVSIHTLILSNNFLESTATRSLRTVSCSAWICSNFAFCSGVKPFFFLPAFSSGATTEVGVLAWGVAAIAGYAVLRVPRLGVEDRGVDVPGVPGTRGLEVPEAADGPGGVACPGSAEAFSFSITLGVALGVSPSTSS